MQQCYKIVLMNNIKIVWTPTGITTIYQNSLTTIEIIVVILNCICVILSLFFPVEGVTYISTVKV